MSITYFIETKLQYKSSTVVKVHVKSNEFVYKKLKIPNKSVNHISSLLGTHKEKVLRREGPF